MIPAAEKARKPTTILRRTRSADDSRAAPAALEPAAATAASIISFESFGVNSDGLSTNPAGPDDEGTEEDRERDGLQLDVEDRGDALKGATISRSVTVHEPWYARAGAKSEVTKQELCVNGCMDAEVVHHCSTCGVNMCLQCASKHATEAKTRSHELISYDEKKMSHLKTGGWNVKIMLGLGMNDDDTVHNLSKKFQEVRLAESVVNAFQNRGKTKGARQGDNPLRKEDKLRAVALRAGEINGDVTNMRASNYLMTGEPGMGDFVNPPSRPLGPLFRQSPKVKGVDQDEKCASQQHLPNSTEYDGSGPAHGRQSPPAVSGGSKMVG